MIIGNGTHRQVVIDILSTSFDDNQSINSIAKQDSKRQQRIQHLMGYCFDICLKSGVVYISDDENACALILYSELKMPNYRQNISLTFNCIGLGNVNKVMKRERLLKAHHPGGLFYHLWFIGVFPEFQNKGIGSKFLEEVLLKCDESKRAVYLETSVERNLPWYKRYGFKTFNELDVDCTLYQMIRN